MSAGLLPTGVIAVPRELNHQRHAASHSGRIHRQNGCRGNSTFHGERILPAARPSHCREHMAKSHSLSSRRVVQVRSSVAIGSPAVSQDGAASDAVITPPPPSGRVAHAHHDMLADADSRFMSFRGVDIHYKRAGLAPDEDEEAEQNGVVVAGPEIPPEEVLQFSCDPYESELEDEEDDAAAEEAEPVKEEKLVIPAVLLHGFGASLFSWERMMEPLAEGLRGPVITFDRPAFGLTGRPKPPPLGDFLKNPAASPYSLAFSTDVTVEFEKRLQKQTDAKPVLIAHSAGCLVAVEAALARPDLIDALVLVAPSIVPPVSSSEASGSSSKSPIKPPEAVVKALQNKDTKKKIRMMSLALSAFLRVAKLRVSTWLYQLQRVLTAGAAEVPLRLNNAIQYLQAKSHEGRFLPLNILDTIASAVLLTVSALAFVLVQIALFLGSLGAGFAAATHAGKFGLKGVSTAFSAAILRSKIAIALLRRAMSLGGVAAVKAAWYDKKKFTEDLKEGYTKPLKCMNWDRALLEYMIAFNLNPATGTKLKDLKCPVLVVTGDSDKIVPGWNAKRVAEAIPKAQFYQIPQCGHLPQEEKPDELLKAILAFVRDEPVRATQ